MEIIYFYIFLQTVGVLTYINTKTKIQHVEAVIITDIRLSVTSKLQDVTVRFHLWYMHISVT